MRRTLSDIALRLRGLDALDAEEIARSYAPAIDPQTQAGASTAAEKPHPVRPWRERRPGLLAEHWAIIAIVLLTILNGVLLLARQ